MSRRGPPKLRIPTDTKEPTPTRDWMSTAITMIVGKPRPRGKSDKTTTKTTTTATATTTTSSYEAKAAQKAASDHRLLTEFAATVSIHVPPKFLYRSVPRPDGVPGHTVPVRPSSSSSSSLPFDHPLVKTHAAVAEGRVSRTAVLLFYQEQPRPRRVVELSNVGDVQLGVLGRSRSQRAHEQYRDAQRAAIESGWKVGPSRLRESWD